MTSPARKRARSEQSEPTVCTFAGGPQDAGYADGPSADAKFNDPRDFALDAFGNLIVADFENHCIRKVTPDGFVSTLAGGGEQQGYVDGPAVNARFKCPSGVAVAADGTVLVADIGNHCLRKVTPDGFVSTLAGGGGQDGYVDGPAANARFRCPSGVAVDVDGTVFVADSRNHCLRKVTPDGMVSTLAGGGEQEGYVDGPAVNARFNEPVDVTVGADGTVLVADFGNHCVRRVTPDGIVSMLAGGGGSEQNGHVDGSVLNARFTDPCSLDMDADGFVIVADNGNHCLRSITPDGFVSTWAGCGGESGYVDGLAAGARFHNVGGVAVDADGVVITSDGHCIRKVKHCSLSRGAGIHRWPGPPSTLAADLSGLLEDGAFADVTFAVAGAQVRAHRAVLAARSSYFRAMLSSGCKEAQPDAVVVVPDVNEAAFRALLAYVYSDRLELDDQSVMDVMCKAHKYDMRSLYKHCMRYVANHISKANVVAWLVAAEAQGLDEALEFCLRFVARHLRGVRKDANEQFDGLQDHPRLMMRILKAI